MNPTWTITTLEHQQNEAQFLQLQPVQGQIVGEQARPFFLKSGLPPGTLAQIWQLADLNKDGKLDKWEFSIAMKLVRNAIGGHQMPAQLPESMRQLTHPMPPMSFGQPFPGRAGSMSAVQTPTAHYGGGGFGGAPMAHGTQTPLGPPLRPASAFGQPVSNFSMGTRELGDWSIPQHLKLKFSQHFNALDRQRIGLLTGQQARGILGESQLPTAILAQIWQLSDVNRDGYLSIEEFCIAMSLIERVREGYQLPAKTPPELAAFGHRSKTASPLSAAGGGMAQMIDPTAPPPQKSPAPKTFEDKRRDNLDRGQAELERRRQILREEEERRRAEIERKERDETERREKERLELECRREAEREAQRQRDFERERERAAEEERHKAEREEARHRLEKERIAELEKIQLKEMEAKVEAEKEKTSQILQRHKTMLFQLQALEEKSTELNNNITVARDEIIGITQEIEKMRESRDAKVARIRELEKHQRELSVQCERLSHENLQLQSQFQHTHGRQVEIEELRRRITTGQEAIATGRAEIALQQERLENQERMVAEKRPDYERSRKRLEEAVEIYNVIVDKFLEAQRAADQRLRRKRQASVDSGGGKQPQTPTAIPTSANQQLYQLPPDATEVNGGRRESAGSVTAKTSAPSSVSASNSTEFKANFESAFNQSAAPAGAQQPRQTSATANQPVKYRALYEFVARSDDELSIQPGDVVLVFEGHASEPGWLAGQIRDKVGWFPAAFAESISTASGGGGGQVGGEGKPATGNTATGSSGPNSAAAVSARMTTSPSSGTEPLASIKEVEESSIAAAAGSMVSQEGASAASFRQSKVLATPLYDAPPGEASVITGSKGAASAEKRGSTASISSGNKSSAAVLGVGTALYQWKARNETELTFNRHDVLEVLEKAEMRWRGRLQRDPTKEGWFPKSYIKMNEEQAETKTDAGVKAEPAASGNQDQPLSVGRAPKKEESTASISSTTSSSTLAAKTKKEKAAGDGEWYVALYHFDAVESSDLSLKVGERIRVIDANDEWWRGVCEDGREGIFPANYVKKEGATDSEHPMAKAIAAFKATAPNQLSLNVGELVRVHTTSPGGWWEGEVDGPDGAKKSGWFPGNYVQLMAGAPHTVTTPTSPPANAAILLTEGPLLARAIYDYVANHVDELSFKLGEMIEVVDHPPDSQWWKGRKQAAGAGQAPLMFPSNFVQVVEVVKTQPGEGAVKKTNE